MEHTLLYSITNLTTLQLRIYSIVIFNNFTQTMSLKPSASTITILCSILHSVSWRIKSKGSLCLLDWTHRTMIMWNDVLVVS